MTAGSLAFLFGICPSAGIYKRLIGFSGRLWIWFWSWNGIDRRRVGLWHGDLFNDRHHRNNGLLFCFRSSRFRCRRFCFRCCICIRFCIGFRGFCLGNGCKFSVVRAGSAVCLQSVDQKEHEYNNCCQNKKNGNQQTNECTCFFRLFCIIGSGCLCWRRHKGLLGLGGGHPVKLTAAVVAERILSRKCFSAIRALFIGIHACSSFGTWLGNSCFFYEV